MRRWKLMPVLFGSMLLFAMDTSYASNAIDLSQQHDLEQDIASKAKLLRLPDGTLVNAYAYASPENATVFDVKAQKERAAKDIWLRYSTDDGVSWSDAANISQTAAKTSKATSWAYDPQTGLQQASWFYGDSQKPNIFNVGNKIAISWVDAYCPARDVTAAEQNDSLPDANYRQGTVKYNQLEGRSIPFHCVRIAYSTDVTLGKWVQEQVTFGLRDAKGDVSRSIGYTKDDKKLAPWVLVWQEDPAGLKTGDAEGPGEGASGANVNQGTDIWQAYVNNLGSADRFIDTVSRVTNNFRSYKRKEGEMVTIAGTGRGGLGDDDYIAPTYLATGKEGASRPNLNLFAVKGGVPKVILAYEETKGGSDGVDFGKVIRYHEYSYNLPPLSQIHVDFNTGGRKGTGKSSGQSQDTITPDITPISAIFDAPDWEDPARIGCVISDPAENARRVRFFGNRTPTAIGSSGTRILFLWKQGQYDEGGASDIVSRVGTVGGEGLSGLSPAELLPAVDTAFYHYTRYLADGNGNYGDELGAAILLDGLPVPLTDAPPSGAIIDVEYPQAGGCNYYLSDVERDELVTLSDVITGNTPGINLSHQADVEELAPSRTIEELQIPTQLNTLEDARAHRGAIKGDTILLGFSYTQDWALAKFTDLANYNFFIRRSLDGGKTWTNTNNISAYEDPTINVKEPRIVATPGSVTIGDYACVDYPDNCSNPDTFVIAWGTQRNTYEQLGSGAELDLFVTATKDAGESYLPLAVMSGDPDSINDEASGAAYESQLRTNPAGNRLYAVWQKEREDIAADGNLDVMVRFLSADLTARDASAERDNSQMLPLVTKEDDSSGSFNPGALLLLLWGLWLRRKAA